MAAESEDGTGQRAISEVRGERQRGAWRARDGVGRLACGGAYDLARGEGVAVGFGQSAVEPVHHGGHGKRRGRPGERSVKHPVHRTSEQARPHAVASRQCRFGGIRSSQVGDE
jgi:hypothetical protein